MPLDPTYRRNRAHTQQPETDGPARTCSSANAQHLFSAGLTSFLIRQSRWRRYCWCNLMKSSSKGTGERVWRGRNGRRIQYTYKCVFVNAVHSYMYIRIRTCTHYPYRCKHTSKQFAKHNYKYSYRTSGSWPSACGDKVMLTKFLKSRIMLWYADPRSCKVAQDVTTVHSIVTTNSNVDTKDTPYIASCCQPQTQCTWGVCMIHCTGVWWRRKSFKWHRYSGR